MTAITADDGPVLRLSGGESNPELRDAVSDVGATVATVGSTGVPAVEPLVAVTRDGRTAFHPRPSPAHVREAIATLDGDIAAGAAAVVDHEPGTTTFPAPDRFGLDVGVRRVLGGCGWRRPTDPDDHAAAGGFVDVEPGSVEAVATALRGRGWGDWCQDVALGDSWRAASAADGDPAVVVNAHGSPADALLLASAPFEVLEGAVAAATAVDADQVLVYCSSDDGRAVERCREAAESYPDPAVPVDVVTGPPAYRAAEPTMAIEALEGNHRLEARLRPPGPDEVGLHGRPTLVHTARTVAHLSVALRTGDAGALGGDGAPDAADVGPPGTRVVTVTGDVASPATVELPESGSIDAALSAVTVDGEFKAACVGGRFGGVTASLDVAPDPAALAGADLGTDGTVEVVAADRCILAFVGRRVQFAADGNCGRCVPCREGTTQLADLLRELYDGDYRADAVDELAGVMQSTSICAFGERAGRPARTAMDEFGEEFEAHAEGHCPAGSCTEALEATP